MNIIEKLCKWYLEKNKYYKVITQLEYDLTQDIIGYQKIPLVDLAKLSSSGELGSLYGIRFIEEKK